MNIFNFPFSHPFIYWGIALVMGVYQGIRGIFIEGAGLAEIVIPFFALLVTGIITFFIGLKFFKWY